MRRLGSVQQKIPCVFLTEVRNEPSRKRECQVGEINHPWWPLRV
uniref:Uncharacterized protein n=1 Tax=Cyprinus carpio TaxID=7962 RepID=A0A8C1S5A4_CYPCA